MQQVFALCYLGELATSKCATTNDEIYHAKWYNYPVKIQKFIILIMMRSQKRFIFKGFSLLSCSLPAFKEVSYYYHSAADQYIFNNGFFHPDVTILCVRVFATRKIRRLKLSNKNHQLFNNHGFSFIVSSYRISTISTDDEFFQIRHFDVAKKRNVKRSTFRMIQYEII